LRTKPSAPRDIGVEHLLPDRAKAGHGNADRAEHGNVMREIGKEK
jgi:hypothetical protein